MTQIASLNVGQAGELLIAAIAQCIQNYDIIALQEVNVNSHSAPRFVRMEPEGFPLLLGSL